MAQQKEIKKTVKQMAEKIGKETAEGQENLIKDLLSQGFQPKDVIGMNEAMIEGIYGQAYRLYNTGKYKDAIELFRFLIMLNATDPKYTMGIAACYHMLKEYKNAASAYTLCAVTDPASPIPYYHASDCYLKMDDKNSALLSLEMALKRIGDKPEYNTIKDRVTRSIESLKKELKPKEKK